MGRQQPGSAHRSESACQVWSRQGGSSQEGLQWAGIQAREVPWGCPWSTRCCPAQHHPATLIAGILGAGTAAPAAPLCNNCRNCSSCCSPAPTATTAAPAAPLHPVQQLQLSWPWFSTAHSLSQLCWRMARTGTICFFHRKWFIGRNCWRAGDLLLINNSKHTLPYNDQSL